MNELVEEQCNKCAGKGHTVGCDLVKSPCGRCGGKGYVWAMPAETEPLEKKELVSPVAEALQKRQRGRPKRGE